MTMPVKGFDFFSGIGGFSFAFKEYGEIVGACDQSQPASAVYKLNHDLEPLVKELSAFKANELASYGADFWLFSPPCQPFTVKGKRRDVFDRRTEGFLNVLALIEDCRPDGFLFENVEGFEGSVAHEMLLELVSLMEYNFLEKTMCPTELGIPNKRLRYFLLAHKGRLFEKIEYARFPEKLGDFLDEEEDESLFLEREIIEKYKKAIHIVRPNGIASCFTSSYGRQIVKSGSYLRSKKRVRRFSPSEISRLLHFPPDFRFPADMDDSLKYRLLGNSVNVAVAGELLKHFDF